MKPHSLIQYYEVQTALLRQERRSSEVSEALKRAKYDLRCSDEKLLNYQSSARSLLDKFFGRREETAEALRREVRNAEAALNALQREKEALDHNRTELTQMLQTLPSSEALRAEGEQEWASLEASYCAEALYPLLEENYKALLEYRSLMRGERPEILSVQKQQEICAEPNVWAERCAPLLQRLKTAMDILDVPFEIGGYYSSPSSYLVAVAAKHNRLDRVNQALDQVLAVEKQTAAILKELSGEEQ